MRRPLTSLGTGLAGVAMLLPGVALAHTGVGATGGLALGFAHPIGGLDHLLAMIAVGLFAATLGGRALWAVPATFVAVMALGGALGMLAFPLPYVELGIALSVVVLGLAVALRRPWPVAAAMALVAVVAVFHGHAHGAEMPVDASSLAYATGFVAATAVLHLVGIAAGLGVAKTGHLRARRLTRAGGAALALAGVLIMTGAV